MKCMFIYVQTNSHLVGKIIVDYLFPPPGDTLFPVFPDFIVNLAHELWKSQRWDVAGYRGGEGAGVVITPHYRALIGLHTSQQLPHIFVGTGGGAGAGRGGLVWRGHHLVPDYSGCPGAGHTAIVLTGDTNFVITPPTLLQISQHTTWLGLATEILWNWNYYIQCHFQTIFRAVYLST